MRIKAFARPKGFSMLDLLCLLAGLAGIAAVVLPMMARSRRTSCHASCTNNLKQVGIGVRCFVLDGNWMSPQQVSVTNGGLLELAESGSAHAVFLAMSNDLVSPRILFCPQEKAPHRRMAYVWETTVLPNTSAGTIPFTTNSLSYFVGIDATDTEPQRILAGDDHFQVAQSKPKPGLLLLATNASVTWRNERHPKRGNILLADASVQDFNSVEFMKQLAKTGLATNRLAMP
jgi:prepilin-type processing-associated H-X9-DG protein